MLTAVFLYIGAKTFWLSSQLFEQLYFLYDISLKLESQVLVCCIMNYSRWWFQILFQHIELELNSLINGSGFILYCAFKLWLNLEYSSFTFLSVVSIVFVLIQ